MLSSCIHHLNRLKCKLPAKSVLRCLSNTNRQSTLRENNIVRHIVNVDVPDESIYSFLCKALNTYNNKVAIVDGITGDTFTYKGLDELIKSFGASISKHGFGEDDVMALLSNNNPQYPVASLGTHACKGTVTPINPSYTVNEIVYQLKDSKAKMLTVEGNLIDNAMKAADITGLDKLFVIGECGIKDSGILQWDDIVQEDHSIISSDMDKNFSDRLAFLSYSSGTTGRPKGVMLTHSNIISNILQFAYFSYVNPTASCLAVLPFFHAYGLVVILLSNLHLGKKIVTLPNFQPETILKSVSEHMIELVNVVPPLFHFLLKHPLVSNYDLSHVKEFTTGAAPCAHNLHTAMMNKFKHSAITQGYGLTETSPVALLQTAANIKPGSTGIPVPGSEIKIFDTKTSESLGPNEIGEVCIRGPHVMKGYLNRAEETANCMTKDGWFHSGDLGYYDDDHHFFIVDRLKELIKYKGFQVPPAELEDLLVSHPGISDAAVIGIPDEEAGELPKAFVVIKEEISEDEVIAFINAKVAPHKKLRGGAEFIDVIPRAPSGKVLRRALRDRNKPGTC